MNTTHLRLAATAGVAVSSVAMAGTVSIVDNLIIGPSSADFAAWKVSGANLSNDNTTPLSTLLQGGPVVISGDTNPQGNVELFASSESGTYNNVASGSLFASVTPVSITGTLQSVPISLRSLNGADWFTTTSSTYNPAYAGASDNDTLARKWFNDFITFYNVEAVLSTAGVSSGTIASERANVYSLLATGGGFARVSDPNISYVIQDDVTDQVSVGLAGTQSFLKQQLLAYIAATPALTAQQKSDVGTAVTAMTIDASELVMINYNGVEMPYYSFIAQSVGLATTDTTESYNQNFDLAFAGVPEPASLSLLGLGVVGLMRRRRG